MIRAALALAAALLASAAAAQGYPSKPITFIIPFAAGGDSDLSGRNLAQHAAKYLNHVPIVPLNKVGASGEIGSMAVRKAAPDGYTLLVARVATHAVLPALQSGLPYKWNDFTFLSLIEMNPLVCFVASDSPIRGARGLIDEIRKNPGKLNFPTAGIGTIQNMAVQYLLTLAGLKKDDAVAIHYKSGGEVTTALLGGQVQFACNNAPTVIPQIKAGKLRALFAMPSRLQQIPDVPSADEVGYPDMDKMVGWTALVGPPGLPKEVVDKWTEVFRKIAVDPGWQEGNAHLGGIPAIRSPRQTERFVREQVDLYTGLVDRLGIRQ